MQKLMKQIFRFAVVGGSAFLIDYGILFVLNEFLGVNYLIASALSFSVSVIYNYILSIFWVFDPNEEQSKKEQFVVFMILSIIGLGINSLIMWISVNALTAWLPAVRNAVIVMTAKVIATFVVMVYNFITRKIYLEK
ncbi:MAG: GtrA family protein [bacterium]|nr:GtrA family protein [bacterium]